MPEDDARHLLLDPLEFLVRQIRVAGALLRREHRGVEALHPRLRLSNHPLLSVDRAAGVVEALLEIVELEDRMRAAAEPEAAGHERRIEPASARKDLCELEDVADVPVRMVVGEDRARDILRRAGRREVSGRSVDRVLRNPGVCHAVAVRVDSPAVPRRGHELHPTGRARGAWAHVPTEVRLDLVDRPEHLPGDAIGGTGGLPQLEELRVRALLRGLRGRRQRERHDDRAGAVRRLGARQSRGLSLRRPGCEHCDDEGHRYEPHLRDPTRPRGGVSWDPSPRSSSLAAGERAAASAGATLEVHVAAAALDRRREKGVQIHSLPRIGSVQQPLSPGTGG